jgi:uncharacterized damage-inducible protein DinB
MSKELDLLFTYTGWLMRRAGDACRQFPEGVFTAPTVFANGIKLGNGSLRETLLHMAMIEQRWIKVRLMGFPYRPANVDFPPENYPTVDSIMQVWHIGRALSMQYLAQHAGELDVPREMIGIFGSAAILGTPRDLFTHALTHTIGHRSDLSSQFSFYGLEAPSFDYIVFVQLNTINRR